jgi:uncharacterized protein YjbI with pentapeptide repeats
MTRASLAALFILGIFVWSVLAMMTLGMSDWLRKSGNSVRFTIWVGAFILVIVTLFAPDRSPLANFRTDAISIAITVIVLDELSRYRSGLEEKERIICQILSQSHDFALEAISIARLNGWLVDGSLRGLDLRGANLSGADLTHADLAGVNLENANLSGTKLTYTNLRNAKLHNANFEKANFDKTDLTGAGLNHAKFVNAKGIATIFDYSDLAMAKIEKAHFHKPSMKHCSLLRASIIETSLFAADMTSALLSGALLSKSSLKNTRLNDADLAGWYDKGLFEDDLPTIYVTHLIDADIAGASFEGARYNKFTWWPEGFVPMSAGAVPVVDGIESDNNADIFSGPYILHSSYSA